MDNDVIIHSDTWVDELEQAIERDPTIGILGLKRKDLWETPNREDDFKSSLRMLPQKEGERWIVVEDVNHVMGTCQMYNYRLIEKMGGLYQMGSLYGFDDSLAAIRCKVAGFKNCFLPHIEIDHIDKNETPYWKEKNKIALEYMAKYNEVKDAYLSGSMSIYHEI
jgi:GT2 family glycosyltransferase